MSFDTRNFIHAAKIYGILLIILFVVGVLQPQKYTKLLLGDGSGNAWQGWTAHIGADLGSNIVAMLAAAAIAYSLDLFGLRQPTGAGTRDLGSRR